MGDFYKRWADGAGKVTKVEALREAQLDLLLGKARPTGDGNDRGVALSKTEGPAVARYTHPYYWAPFVLMGNWR
jgi:CHAT domain-containing protein